MYTYGHCALRLTTFVKEFHILKFNVHIHVDVLEEVKMWEVENIRFSNTHESVHILSYFTSHECKFWFWHHLSRDTFFFLDFFAPRFPHLVDSFPAVWHLRHRFHLYNVGDDLLYHSNSLRRREFPFDSSGSHLTGKVDVSRLGSFVYRVCAPPRLRCLAAFSLSFQFTFSVDGAGRNISGMRSTTCLRKSKSEYHFSSFLLVESSTVQTDSLSFSSFASPFSLHDSSFSLSFFLYFLAFLSSGTKIEERKRKNIRVARDNVNVCIVATRYSLGAVKAEDLVAKEARIHGWRSAVPTRSSRIYYFNEPFITELSVRNESLSSADNF